MGRPRIGITAELEAARWGSWIREAVLSPVSYVRAVDRAGGVPLVLPPVPPSAIPDLLAGLDGIVFSGGRDLGPGLYDEEPHPLAEEPDHRRDRFEMALIRAAIGADLPFLAIGRGLQLLNVARGGTLTQHLPDRLGPGDGHGAGSGHDPVTVSPASTVGRALDQPRIKLSAVHHQAVNRIGTGLLTVAWTDDQVAEALELQGHAFGVGVQWHPEEAGETALFAALVRAAAGQVSG